MPGREGKTQVGAGEGEAGAALSRELHGACGTGRPDFWTADSRTPRQGPLCASTRAQRLGQRGAMPAPQGRLTQGWSQWSEGAGGWPLQRVPMPPTALWPSFGGCTPSRGQPGPERKRVALGLGVLVFPFFSVVVSFPVPAVPGARGAESLLETPVGASGFSAGKWGQTVYLSAGFLTRNRTIDEKRSVRGPRPGCGETVHAQHAACAGPRPTFTPPGQRPACG